jgi:hypothetical protein
MLSTPTSVTGALNTFNALLNGGTLVIYGGTVPAGPGTALSGQTALATWTFAGTAFGAPAQAGSVMEAAAAFAATSVTPSNSGTGTFARSFKSDGTTPVADYTVGTTGTDVVLTTATFSPSVSATLSSFKHRMPL